MPASNARGLPPTDGGGRFGTPRSALGCQRGYGRRASLSDKQARFMVVHTAHCDAYELQSEGLEVDSHRWMRCVRGLTEEPGLALCLSASLATGSW